MVDVSGMIRIEDLRRADLDDTEELVEMAKSARNYVQMHSWCQGINAGYFVWGVADIFAIFFFEIEPAPNADERSGWVIFGDVSPAYIDAQICGDLLSALTLYVDAVQEWVNRVRTNQPIDDLVPVTYQNSTRPLEPTLENAGIIESRLRTIEQHIIPELESSMSGRN